MKKICIVTAARSEYGVLRWIIDEVYHDKDLELQLVVTGAHLSEEQGMTVQFIEQDGYPIAERVPILQKGNDDVAIAKTMGKCSSLIAETFKRLQPDMVVVLGDRYELLPIASTALVMRLPVAHISGGDVTEGAIDDEVRNAVTMMSTLHFPGVEASAENIRRMRGSDKNVFAVGEPGLDSFLRLDLLSKEKTAKLLDLDSNKKWCLVTLHPETKLTLDENLCMAHNLYEAMRNTQGIQYVITKANADLGGSVINEFWASAIENDKDTYRLYSSLGQLRYLSFMKFADMVVGNSSSGIIEAPFMGTPVVNIGDRQKGRYMGQNILCCGRDIKNISNAIGRAISQDRAIDTYWGDGHSSERIVAAIKRYLGV